MHIFAGQWGKGVRDGLVAGGVHTLGKVEYSSFPNGEKRVVLQSAVVGQECVAVQSFAPKADEALVELLLLIDALRENGAKRVVAFVPYFGYSLNNRHFDGEPISVRAVARAICSAKPDEVWTYDLHHMGSQEFFDVKVKNFGPAKIFAEHLGSLAEKPEVVVAPDDGAEERAREIADILGVRVVVGKKVRNEKTTEITELEFELGDHRARVAVLVDDMINTGGTVVRAAKKLKGLGVERVFLCATHFLGVPGSLEKVLGEVDKLITTNSVEHGLEDGERVKVTKIQYKHNEFEIEKNKN